MRKHRESNLFDDCFSGYSVALRCRKPRAYSPLEDPANDASAIDHDEGVDCKRD